MRELKNKKFARYGKQYKDYFYTVERLKNTPQGHPNFEVYICKINRRFDIQGNIYRVSTYEDIHKYTEKFIDNKGGELYD